MTRRSRRNYTPGFKTKVALVAYVESRRLANLLNNTMFIPTRSKIARAASCRGKRYFGP